MTFTLENILNSLAGVLKAKYSYPVYTSPHQQGTDFPCFFIFYTPSKIEEHVGNRHFRDLGVDITFVQQRNIVNGNAELIEIAGYLDENLDLFKYSDGKVTVWMRTFERQWQDEDGELHYQFHIRQRVIVPETGNRMQRLEEDNTIVKREK